MPLQDGTGPNGNGPQTGRGLGKCNPNQDTGNNQGMGLRRRCGFDCGRGRFQNRQNQTNPNNSQN